MKRIQIKFIIFVETLDDINYNKIKKELMKNSKEYLIEMLIDASIKLEDSSIKCEFFRRENMIGKKSIGGIVV